MNELICSKEAKLLLAQEKEVQYLDIRSAFKTLGWCDANNLTGYQFSMKHYKFRLKPRTITINGIEVPKSSDTYSGGLVWILCGTDTREYTSLALDQDDELPAYFWRTEDEIKQVVAALRKVFKGE